MTVYLVECHDCDHSPYRVEVADGDPAPTKCMYCGSTNITATQES